MFIPLSSIKEVQEHSQQETIIIFKHSSACPISAAAYHRLEKGVHEKTLAMPIYLVVVQDNRTVSNDIAKVLDVKHESPQCIIVENGEVILVLNHHRITVDNIQNGTPTGDQNLVCPVA